MGSHDKNQKSDDVTKESSKCERRPSILRSTKQSSDRSIDVEVVNDVDIPIDRQKRRVSFTGNGNSEVLSDDRSISSAEQDSMCSKQRTIITLERNEKRSTEHKFSF